MSIVGYSAISRVCPKVLFNRTKLTIPKWEFMCKYEVHASLGEAFFIFTPGNNVIVVAESEMAHALLARRKDFGRIETGASTLHPENRLRSAVDGAVI